MRFWLIFVGLALLLVKTFTGSFGLNFWIAIFLIGALAGLIDLLIVGLTGSVKESRAIFGWFKRKQPETHMDAFIKAAYGDKTKNTANLSEAIALANGQLLQGKFDLREITGLATQLNDSPIPYSTCDLAASVALGLLKKVPMDARKGLMEVQLTARLTVVTWMKEGKVAPLLAEAFENTLYKDYHPNNFS